MVHFGRDPVEPERASRDQNAVAGRNENGEDGYGGERGCLVKGKRPSTESKEGNAPKRGIGSHRSGYSSGSRAHPHWGHSDRVNQNSRERIGRNGRYVDRCQNQRQSNEGRHSGAGKGRVTMLIDEKDASNEDRNQGIDAIESSQSKNGEGAVATFGIHPARTYRDVSRHGRRYCEWAIRKGSMCAGGEKFRWYLVNRGARSARNDEQRMIVGLLLYMCVQWKKKHVFTESPAAPQATQGTKNSRPRAHE